MIIDFKYLEYVLKTSLTELDDIIVNIKSYYSSWEKPKINKDTNQAILDSSGNIKTRTINSTRNPLKKIQRRIYKFLLERVYLPDYFFGGVPKKDNVLNAKFHQGNKYIFTTDLKSFFPSISNEDVFNMFLELEFHPSIARKLTQLTTINYQIPQGVPTSTLIANLVFKKTGDKLKIYTDENNMKFTIFVDDLTVSSKYDFKDKIPDILAIITGDGYKISHKKTFYKTKNPVITGVICQNNKIKLPHVFHKRISRLEKANSGEDKISVKERLEGIKLYRNKISAINKRN